MGVSRKFQSLHFNELLETELWGLVRREIKNVPTHPVCNVQFHDLTIKNMANVRGRFRLRPTT